MTRMKTAAVIGAREIRLEHRELPEIGADEVLVRVKALGIGEADLYCYRHGPDAAVAVEDYLRMGRGTAGEVVGVGADVADREAGQRVAVTPGYPCFMCDACREGGLSRCLRVGSLDEPAGRSYAEYIAVPADHTCVLPESIGWDEAVMVVPLSVGFHAARRGGVSVSVEVGIIGADEVGRMCLMACRASGAGRVVVADPYAGKLDAALNLGATDTIDSRLFNPVAAVDGLTSGEGLGVVFETTGRPGALMEAVGMTGHGGVVVLTGAMPPVQSELGAMDVIVKELDIRGVVPRGESPEPAVTMLSRGLVNLENAITDRFPFEQIGDALRYADEREDEAVEIIVEL